jgi:hypothetical protein
MMAMANGNICGRLRAEVVVVEVLLPLKNHIASAHWSAKLLLLVQWEKYSLSGTFGCLFSVPLGAFG